MTYLVALFTTTTGAFGMKELPRQKYYVSGCWNGLSIATGDGISQKRILSQFLQLCLSVVDRTSFRTRVASHVQPGRRQNNGRPSYNLRADQRALGDTKVSGDSDRSLRCKIHPSAYDAS